MAYGTEIIRKFPFWLVLLPFINSLNVEDRFPHLWLISSLPHSSFVLHICSTGLWNRTPFCHHLERGQTTQQGSAPGCLKAPVLSVLTDGFFLLAECMWCWCGPESSFIIWRINRLLVKLTSSVPLWPTDIYTAVRKHGKSVGCLYQLFPLRKVGLCWKGGAPLPQGHNQPKTVGLTAQ